ncbi:hypothetical protein [Tepidimonas charontis]|uniref:Uncharacterized protein n=1 Tax=Tepidimonas charontis TaxID=2267262 RepID=A0A554XJX2_9BURK|nr:hypothetical protein [Tepidimonas charontis]TSE36123.1 hypothetical protein Tchar_00169 [Tepidimonas charontis]
MDKNRQWWQTVPWNERTRGQKIAMIAGWFVIISVLIVGVIEQPKDDGDSRKQIGEAKTTEPIPQPQVSEGTKLNVPSAKNVKDFLARLDESVKAADLALQRGDLKSLHEQSKLMNQIAKDGEKFGNSVFEEPYGYCFGAGVFAQTWWLARLNAARRGGVEAIHGEIADALKQYQQNRSACEAALDAGGNGVDTKKHTGSNLAK